jgi:acetyltransferase-like isoleucine patch superfamily enzyme
MVYRIEYKDFKDADELSEYFGLDCKVAIAKNATVSIGDFTIIDVSERLIFNGDALIRDNVRISGRDIEVGHKFYMDHHAEIGGGSCKGDKSKLRIGKCYHQGSYAMVNTAREVTIGDVVGIGRFSNITTHGTYLNVLDGFPEQWGPINIGNNVWLPCAIVMPNVSIGDNTVVAAQSVVNRNIVGGGLWAGIPAKRIDGVNYPNPMNELERKKYLETLGTDDKEELRRHGIRMI